MPRSRKIIDDKKKEIDSIGKERKRLLKYLSSDTRLIEGSYSELLVRCSLPDCSCREIPCHPVTRISWYEDGKIKKNKIVRVVDREKVKKLSREYQNHKKAMSTLVKLNEKEKSALKQIMQAKMEKYV